MTVTAPPALPTEMSFDHRFQGRLKRLILVSSVALGLIFLLAASTTDAGWTATGLLLGGWVLMPTLLYAGLGRPRFRYLLTVPAAMVSAGLLLVAVGLEGPPMAVAGWWLITAGVMLGGSLGAWFWYRLLPVPRRLDDPFSAGRWALISVHVGLVVIGAALVLLGQTL
ncbi:MAG TPA: hypothetical protein VI980_07485 [Acidimicrobiia bacterium]|nr:hypothetical protein [Acidimicrobiia bacterium]